MRLTRVRVLLTATLVAAAGTAAGTALAASPAAPQAGQVVLVQCNGSGQVKPAGTNEPGCMPSNQFIASMKWVSWRGVAYGSGVYKVNNCTPSSSCGPGKFTRYPMLIVLWRPEPWRGHAGRDFFTRITVIFNTAKHPHGPAAQTSVLPAG